jgi:hypothetical protein
MIDWMAFSFGFCIGGIIGFFGLLIVMSKSNDVPELDEHSYGYDEPEHKRRAADR